MRPRIYEPLGAKTSYVLHTSRVLHRRIIALGIAVVALAAVAAAPAGSAGCTAKLRVAKAAPLSVRGTHFRKFERVRLVVSGAAERTKTVRASKRGSFSAKFDGVVVHACGDGLAITASGNHGSRVAMKLPQRECPPGLEP